MDKQTMNQMLIAFKHLHLANKALQDIKNPYEDEINRRDLDNIIKEVDLQKELLSNHIAEGIED